jgi:hypothetical protein
MVLKELYFLKSSADKHKKYIYKITRPAWAGFRYCGTRLYSNFGSNSGTAKDLDSGSKANAQGQDS